MSVIKGPVRYRFRYPDDGIDVMIEGEAAWVQATRDALGLEGVGWLQPMAATRTSHSIGEASSGDDSSASKGRPGPEPDPSKVPTVRRTIGQMDLTVEMAKLDIEQPRSPGAAELAEWLDDEEEPEALTSVVSTDPMAEAWLQSLMRIAVREFGVTALPTEVIDEACGDRLGRNGVGLEVWLDGMWRLGKLVKIHGGGRIGYGPSPKWLEAF